MLPACRGSEQNVGAWIPHRYPADAVPPCCDDRSSRISVPRDARCDEPSFSLLEDHSRGCTCANFTRAYKYLSSLGTGGSPHWGKPDCLHLCYGPHDGGALGLVPTLLLHALETKQILLKERPVATM